MDNKSVMLPKWIDKSSLMILRLSMNHALWKWFIIQINHTNL